MQRARIICLTAPKAVIKTQSDLAFHLIQTRITLLAGIFAT